MSIEIGQQVGLLEHHAKPWQLGALSPCLVSTLVIAFLYEASLPGPIRMEVVVPLTGTGRQVINYGTAFPR
jgi:hypothetical protein